MTPSEEFLRHADECQHMAKHAHDPEVRRTWIRMAERWHHCANLAKDHESALQVRKARLFRKAAHPD